MTSKKHSGEGEHPGEWCNEGLLPEGASKSKARARSVGQHDPPAPPWAIPSRAERIRRQEELAAAAAEQATEETAAEETPQRHAYADAAPWLTRIQHVASMPQLEELAREAEEQRVSFSPDDMPRVRAAVSAKQEALLQPAAPPETAKDRAARRKRDAAERKGGSES